MAPTLLPNVLATIMPSTGPATSTALNPVFTPADPVNGNYFIASGRDLVVVYNTDIIPHHLTVLSAPDACTGRRSDVVNYVIPPINLAGSPPTVDTFAHVAFLILPSSVFTQTDGSVQLSADNALVLFLIRSI